MPVRIRRAAWWGGTAAGLVALTTLAIAVGRLTRMPEPDRVIEGGLEVGLMPRWRIPPEAGSPMDLSPTSDGRLLIATRNGRIFLVDASGQLQNHPFLDMTTAGITLFTADEGGLCGLAVGPRGGRSDGKIYTFTTELFSPANRADFSHPELRPTGPGIPADQVVIREWTIDPSNRDRALPTSRTLLRINHPGTTHHGGGLAFGPDGCLYISMGDGGGGNDRDAGRDHALDGHTDSIGNAQDLTNPFGKILRIDPAGTDSANGQYGVPRDNPFAKRRGDLAEIYAYGLRNPYRIGFDPPSRRLYVGDVGQSNREEVNLIRWGANYGWPLWEGTRYNGAATGRTAPGGPMSSWPIAEYTHWDGMAIIGGFVYRGKAIPELTGKYVFGDYFHAEQKAGRLFYMDANGGPITEFRYARATGLLACPPEALVGFGRDGAGELYALFDDGRIVQIGPPRHNG